MSVTAQHPVSPAESVTPASRPLLERLNALLPIVVAVLTVAVIPTAGYVFAQEKRLTVSEQQDAQRTQEIDRQAARLTDLERRAAEDRTAIARLQERMDSRFDALETLIRNEREDRKDLQRSR